MLGLMAGSALSTLGTIASVAMVKMTTSSRESLFKYQFGPIQLGSLAVGAVMLGQALASWSATEAADEGGYLGKNNHLSWAAFDFAVAGGLLFGPMFLHQYYQTPSFEYILKDHPGLVKNVIYSTVRNSMDFIGMGLLERHSTSTYFIKLFATYSEIGSYIIPVTSGVYHLYKQFTGDFEKDSEHINENNQPVNSGQIEQILKQAGVEDINSMTCPVPQFNFNVKNCVNCKFITSNDNENDTEEVLFDKCTMRQMVEELLKERSAIDYEELEKAVTNDNMGQVIAVNESNIA